MGTVGAEDGFFVTFAKNEDEVARLSYGNSFFDGGGAVGDFDDL